MFYSFAENFQIMKEIRSILASLILKEVYWCSLVFLFHMSFSFFICKMFSTVRPSLKKQQSKHLLTSYHGFKNENWRRV